MRSITSTTNEIAANRQLFSGIQWSFILVFVVAVVVIIATARSLISMTLVTVACPALVTTSLAVAPHAQHLQLAFAAVADDQLFIDERSNADLAEVAMIGDGSGTFLEERRDSVD